MSGTAPPSFRIWEETGVCPCTCPEWCKGCEYEHPLREIYVTTYEHGYWCWVCNGRHGLSFCCRREDRGNTP
jgi:hypothetical protein